ncbi:MAG: VWA domain-containing protein [Planctomycetota bacterium]
MNYVLDHPWMLLGGLVVIPMVGAGWLLLRSTDVVKRIVVLGLRAALMLIIVVLLAGPRAVREDDRMTVVGVLDISDSVRRFATPLATADDPEAPILGQLETWFDAATSDRRTGDRAGLVVFDGRSTALRLPDTRPGGADIDVGAQPGTNIADAVNLGLSLLPAAGPRRLVLMSDGNQTSGDALAAAERAARIAGERTAIPIDVLPLTYRIERDVQVSRIEVPQTARPGQRVVARVVLEATGRIDGRLSIDHEGRPVDLDPSAPGNDRAMTTRAGETVVLVPITLGTSPVNRFEARFRADEPDAIPDNDAAESFTVTSGAGRWLVVDADAGTTPNALATMLRSDERAVEVIDPAALPTRLLDLHRYDLIVLDDLPAWHLEVEQHALLVRYVHDLGGGLLMVGGEQAFGAGGWNGSELETVLPLHMDPPRQLILPQAALVLVLDKSGSMARNVAGARATQQSVANEAAALAIESLRTGTYIGVIAFDSFAREVVPLEVNDDPAAITKRVRGISPDGGTDLRRALVRADRMLAGVDVPRKRVVCLSDGQSPTDGLVELVEQMAARNIQVTTIAVGDDADDETLEKLAAAGGGQFHAVRNPRVLPRVLLDSVQVVNRPLIKEGRFDPAVLPTGSPLTAGLRRAPALGGLVITGPREETTAVIEATHPDGDPLLAHWQAGLGHVAAFTSDVGGAWSEEWSTWSGASEFWLELALLSARTTTDLDTELTTRFEDDRMLISLEMLDTSGDSGDGPTIVDGWVYSPDGARLAVQLVQTAPGTFQTAVPASQPGNYIVALSPRRGDELQPPTIGGASRASGPEYRYMRSNAALLRSIAQRTGGRDLGATPPLEAALFDRGGEEPTRTLLPAWPPLLWMAIGLLLMDIAGRRLAWDGRRITGLVERAFRREAPARESGEAAAATLAILREAGEEQDEAASTPGSASPATTPSPEPAAQEPPRKPEGDAPDTSKDTRAAAKRPDGERVAAALDVLLGRGRQKQPPPPVPPDDDETGDVAATTNSLLEARRRARRARDEGEHDA